MPAQGVSSRHLEGVESMNGVQQYVSWGFVHISIGNLMVIVLMIVVFALAVLLPFPGGKGSDQ